MPCPCLKLGISVQWHEVRQGQGTPGTYLQTNVAMHLLICSSGSLECVRLQLLFQEAVFGANINEDVPLRPSIDLQQERGGAGTSMACCKAALSSWSHHEQRAMRVVVSGLQKQLYLPSQVFLS